MMKVNRRAVKIEREYTISQKELKEKLGITGDVRSAGLFSGISPRDEEAGVSSDNTLFYIFTIEEKKKK